MKRKPLGWPAYMETKTSKGVVRYYWSAPSWARKRGCPVNSEALGSDYAIAKARCDTFLNPLFDSWRTGGAADNVQHRAVVGSFDWAISAYKVAPKYTKKPARTRSSYDRALAQVADFLLTDGRRFGSLSVKGVRPDVVDLLYEKLKVDKAGKPRHRSALLSMAVCKIAWSIALRSHPTIIPPVNPFAKLEVEYDPKKNRASTLEELNTFVAAADADGSASLGTAAMIAFYWMQREEDIFERFAWSDYRPASRPNHVLIWHQKNRKSEKIPIPLFATDGTALFSEMTARLENVNRRGTLIIMRDTPDPKKKVHLPWATGGRNPMRYVQGEVRRICRAAGLPDVITFTSFRHGGHTEGADAGLTDAQMRALGGHKTTAALLRYTKETDTQRQVGARKRLDARTKKGNLSK